MNDFQARIVLPGDDVTSLLTPSSKDKNNIQIKLGTGLVHNPPNIYCTLAGTLNQTISSSRTYTYYIRNNTKRYIPQLNDRVIGIIEEKYGDYYKVNIFGPHPAYLPVLAFENATKRNRPHLNIGTTIYCRIDSLIGGNSLKGEAMLSCQVSSSSNKGLNDGGANRKDWMTNENTYGELKGGTHIKISLGLARQLLHPQNVVLMALEKQELSFEIAIGVNGIVWIHSPSEEISILICNVIQNSEVLTSEQVRGMVRDLVKRIQR